MQLRLAVAAAALAGLLSVPTARSAESASPPSTITHVTLYGGRAEVRRETDNVRLAAGDNRLVFPLPASLIESTPRALVSGAGGARVANVEVRSTRERGSTPTDPPEVAGLRSELAGIEAEIAGLAAGDEFLDGIRPGIRGEVAASGAAGWSEMLSFLTESVRVNQARAGDARRRQADVQRRIEEARDATVRATAGRAAREVVVEVRADTETRVDLVLEYAVAGATWHPEYDIDVAEDFASVRLVYYGVLTQSTGEDWDAATVVLATRQPADEFASRQLVPWRLAASPPPEHPPPTRGGRTVDVQQSATVRVIDSASASRLEAIRLADEVIGTTVAPGGWSASFEIAEPLLLPSDGSPRRLRIASERLETAVRHEAIPLLGDRAFLVADARNTTERPFLAGRTRVTLAGAFVGNGTLEDVAPSQEFTLALGEDPYVSVQTKTLERSETPQGHHRRLRARDRIEVTSHRARPVDILLRDRVPVSIDGDVDVRALTAEPTALPDEDGILEWRFTLDPGGSWRAETGFEVRYPEGRRPPNL